MCASDRSIAPHHTFLFPVVRTPTCLPAHRWELSQAVLRGLRLGKTVALIVADYKLQDWPLWGTGGPKDKRMSKEAEAALAEAERGERVGKRG